MIATLQHIVEQALERLTATTNVLLPSLLAAGVILVGALALASLLRWSLARLVRAAAFDRFMVQSGIASLTARSGRVAAGRLLAQTVYWAVLLTGVLTALTAFNTSLTSHMAEAAVLLLPKLVTAGAILLAGVWLGRYLGRGMLVWACNEGVPHARHAAAAVRILIIFVAAVVAADHMNFARDVFLAAFILVLGGAVLAASIAAGLGIHAALERRLGQYASERQEEKSLWNHL